MNWKTYKSEDPSHFANGDILIELMVWLSEKKRELIETSCTSALWISYITYISFVQEFIWAERTSNWNLHMCATKSMVNLFVATGHSNYAYIFSCYQIWNRITQRSTRDFRKVLFKFLVNKISAETFCEVIEIFYWCSRQVICLFKFMF